MQGKYYTDLSKPKPLSEVPHIQQTRCPSCKWLNCMCSETNGDSFDFQQDSCIIDCTKLNTLETNAETKQKTVHSTEPLDILHKDGITECCEKKIYKKPFQRKTCKLQKEFNDSTKYMKRNKVELPVLDHTEIKKILENQGEIKVLVNSSDKIDRIGMELNVNLHCYDNIILFLLNNARQRCPGCFIYHTPRARWSKRRLESTLEAAKEDKKENYQIGSFQSEDRSTIPKERTGDYMELKSEENSMLKMKQSTENQPSHIAIMSLLTETAEDADTDEVSDEEQLVPELESSWDVYTNHLIQLVMEKENLSHEEASIHAEEMNFWPHLGFTFEDLFIMYQEMDHTCTLLNKLVYQ